MQDKEQTIAILKAENYNVSSALNAAESRLTELYTEQSRMDEEMAARIEVAEKLRAQVHELEKERRDLHRRYNEQVRRVHYHHRSGNQHGFRPKLSKPSDKHSMTTSTI